MQGKTLLIVFGILLLLVNLIGTLMTFNISFSFLSFIPANLAIFTIISGVLALIMLILGINPNTY